MSFVQFPPPHTNPLDVDNQKFGLGTSGTRVSPTDAGSHIQKVDQVGVEALSQNNTSNPGSDSAKVFKELPKGLVAQQRTSRPAEDEQQNYVRLYDAGTAINSCQRVKTKLEEYNQEGNVSTTTVAENSSKEPSPRIFRFKISAPEDLVAGNMYLRDEIQGRVISNFSRLNLVVTPCDKKLLGGEKVLTILKKHGLIDEGDFLIVEKFLDSSTFDAVFKDITDTDQIQHIRDILYCIEYRSRSSSISLRLTRTNILLPRVLVEMSQGQISMEVAQALLTRLGIVRLNKKPEPLINLETGELDLNESLLSSGKYSFVLTQPDASTLDQTALEALHNKEFDKLTQPKVELIKKNKEIQRKIIKLLKPFFAFVRPSFVRTFLSTLEKDHPIVPFGLYNWFFEVNGWDNKWSRELWRKEPHPLFWVDLATLNDASKPLRVKRCSYLDLAIDEEETVKHSFDNLMDKIHRYLKKTLKDMEAAGTHPKKEDFEKLILKQEGDIKKSKASLILNLEEEFKKIKHVIEMFVTFSRQVFALTSPVKYKVEWDLADVTVNENLSLEKNLSFSRRVEFTSHGSERKDLTYFSTEKEKDSVLERWQNIARVSKLSDAALAGYCIKLYSEGSVDIDPNIKNFLVPLVVLLLGKEPALDNASVVSNFLLLKSVEMGVCSFQEALKTMPMIPQGAVSAKQFLLHVTSRPLDFFSGVQYKKSKTIKPSYFLTHSESVVGRAEEWIERYDDVITICVRCCTKMLQAGDYWKEADPEIVKLQEILEGLLSRKIPFSELAEVLKNEAFFFDDEDLVGEWALRNFVKLHPLY